MVSTSFFIYIRLTSCSFFFFLNDTAPTEIYPLSLHDALPISDHARPGRGGGTRRSRRRHVCGTRGRDGDDRCAVRATHPSVYGRVTRRRSPHRRAARAAPCDPRSGAGGDRVAARVPLSSPLSLRVGEVRRRGAAVTRCR